MAMTEQQKQLLGQIIEPLIKGETDLTNAKELFHQYTVSKTRDIIESGTPLDNKAEPSTAANSKEIKADGEQVDDPKEAKTSSDVVNSRDKVKPIKAGPAKSGDPLDNKAEPSTADDSKEIKA